MDNTAALNGVLEKLQNLQLAATSFSTQIGNAVEQLQTVSPEAATRVISPGMDLVDILANTPPETVIVCQPGVYNASLRLFPHNSPNSRIIRLQTPPVLGRINPAAQQLAHFRSQSNLPAIDVQGGRYLLQGLQASSVNKFGTLVQVGNPIATSAALQPEGIYFDRCFLTGDPILGQKRGMGIHGKGVALDGCVILEIRGQGQDTQGIYCNNSPGELLIVDSTIEATGENVLFGGDRCLTPDLVPTDITILNSLMRKPAVWGAELAKWDLKNLLEFKTGKQVRIAGCILDGNWPDAQTGYAVLFTTKNQYGDNPWTDVSDVVMESNIIRNVSSAFNISGYDSAGFVSARMTGMVLRNNLAIVDRFLFGGDGRFLQVGNGTDGLIVENNTAITNGSSCVTAYASGSVNPYKSMPNAAFRRNLFVHNAYGFKSDAGIGNPTLTKYFPGVDFVQNVLAGGLAKNYPVGNDFPTVAAFQAAFVDWAAGNYRLIPGGPWEGRGADFLDLPVG